jgi:arginine N-succinyltransferase
MNFQEADHFNAIHGNQFIADLMPKHPIYTAMLPETARAVIGLPHPSGRAAMRMLENEGFAYERYVDIFDGGPTMTVRTDQIRSVREARRARVAALGAGEEPMLVATGRLAEFRCAFGKTTVLEHGVTLDTGCANVLALGAGDEVFHVARV